MATTRHIKATMIYRVIKNRSTRGLQDDNRNQQNLVLFDDDALPLFLGLDEFMLTQR